MQLLSQANMKPSKVANSKNMRQQSYQSGISLFATIVGALAIVLAGISLATNMDVSDMLAWLERYFGISFLVFYAALVALSVLAIWRVVQAQSSAFWFQVGIQAANGISTLALTYTLLGISLGIGALSEQSLNPETVDRVISTLTAQFSIAFMTSVLGLPSAAIVRALLSIMVARINTSTAQLES